MLCFEHIFSAEGFVLPASSQFSVNEGWWWRRRRRSGQQAAAAGGQDEADGGHEEQHPLTGPRPGGQASPVQ